MLNSNISRVSTHWWTNHGDHLCLPLVFCQPHYIPSGNLTYSHWQWLFIYIYIIYIIYYIYIYYIYIIYILYIYIFGLPLKNGDFPVRYANVYRRVKFAQRHQGIQVHLIGNNDLPIGNHLSIEPSTKMWRSDGRWIDGIPTCPMLGIIILGYRWYLRMG